MSDFDKDFGFCCENCDAMIGGGPSDFYESVQEKKDAGWLSRKVDGEWFDPASSKQRNRLKS